MLNEPDHHQEFREVLATFNPGDVAFISSVLDGEGVRYYFSGENFNRIRPMVEPVRLMVLDEDIEKVRDILKDIGLTFGAITTG